VGVGVPGTDREPWAVDRGQKLPESMVLVYVLIVRQRRVIICKMQLSGISGVGGDSGVSRPYTQYSPGSRGKVRFSAAAARERGLGGFIEGRVLKFV